LEAKALVSVVMSVYNSAAHLCEAIDSILNQTYQNFEFIIINDGSTDESLNMIQSYQDKRIRLIDNSENKGLIYSLNKGFEMAMGKYIARMDADDISLPERLEKQVAFMEAQKQIGVCTCDYTQFSARSSKTYLAWEKHDEMLAQLLFNSCLVHPSLLIRKESLNALNTYFDSNFLHAEDYELWTRLILKCKFSKVPEVLFEYRLHENQVSQKHKTVQMESANKVRAALLSRLGFTYQANDFDILCKLGNSQIIESHLELNQLLNLMRKLMQQNKTSNVIDTNVFEKTLNKYWYDACGHTNLGVKAFATYIKSDFFSKYKGSLIKLFVKCLTRRF
jgi:glycosyltransferase involved in cell wall biosynthesis